MKREDSENVSASSSVREVSSRKGAEVTGVKLEYIL